MTISSSKPQDPEKKLLASSYNDVPYTSSVYQQSQPNRLHSLAKMKGLNPPEIETAKILEIGCSFGGNIIPFAIFNPQSQIVGLDLSEYQIQVGKQIIDHIGLDNVTLIAGDISQVTFDQKFDYIICHGVYSWVPESVRKAILTAIERYLSPNGVAYISYNTYPGWKEKDIVKDLMKFGCNLNDAPDIRYQQATSILNFTKTLNEEKLLPFKQMEWLNSVLKAPSKSYVIHEYLEYFNQPFYLKEFIEQINQHHLAYITDSSTPALLMPLLGENDNYERLCQYFGHNAIDIEQYLDFIHNRTFRGSLITHRQNLQEKGISEHILDYNRCHDLQNLYLHTIVTHHSKQDGIKDYWTILNEGSLKFESTPSAKIVFEYLQQQSPNPVRIEEILNYAKSQPGYDEARTIDLCLVLVHLNPVYISYTNKPLTKLGRKLKLNPKFRKLIQFIQTNPGIINLSNRFYQTYNFSVLENILVPYLDGSNTITDLVSIVRKMIDEDYITWNRDNAVIPASEVKDKEIKEMIKNTLVNLHSHGYFWEG